MSIFQSMIRKKNSNQISFVCYKEDRKDKIQEFHFIYVFSIILFAGKILEWTQLRRTDWRGFHPQTIEFWWRLQQIYRFIVWRNIGSGSKHRKTSKNKTQSSPINRKYHWFSLYKNHHYFAKLSNHTFFWILYCKNNYIYQFHEKNNLYMYVV